LLTALVYPSCLAVSFQVNFVDQRVTTPKAWRDVYRYDAKGTMTGWTRYDGVRAQEFNTDGHVILTKDAQGRAVKARSVKYEYERAAGWPGFGNLKQQWGNEILYYEYKNAQDLTGHVKKKESATGDK
jgi:YD repeat-containing protein